MSMITFVFIRRIGCSSDDLGEDDPIGWFELEEEWDEADVKLQQCRVAKVSSSQVVLHSFTCFPFLQTLLTALALSQHWNVRGVGRDRCDMTMTEGGLTHPRVYQRRLHLKESVKLCQVLEVDWTIIFSLVEMCQKDTLQ